MIRNLFPLTPTLVIMALVSSPGLTPRHSQAGEARPDSQQTDQPLEKSDPRRWRGRPISPRVLVINFDPVIEAEGGRRLHEVCGWNDPRHLTQGYIDDVRETSGGYVRYRVVDWLTVDEYPVKKEAPNVGDLGTGKSGDLSARF